jgi:hypothetical protein
MAQREAEVISQDAFDCTAIDIKKIEMTETSTTAEI